MWFKEKFNFEMKWHLFKICYAIPHRMRNRFIKYLTDTFLSIFRCVFIFPHQTLAFVLFHHIRTQFIFWNLRWRHIFVFRLHYSNFYFGFVCYVMMNGVFALLVIGTMDSNSIEKVFTAKHWSDAMLLSTAQKSS